MHEHVGIWNSEYPIPMCFFYMINRTYFTYNHENLNYKWKFITLIYLYIISFEFNQHHSNAKKQEAWIYPKWREKWNSYLAWIRFFYFYSILWFFEIQDIIIHAQNLCNDAHTSYLAKETLNATDLRHMTNLDIWIYSTRINTLQTAIFAKCGRCGYLPTLLN